jgi:hypothetical protein
MLPSLIGSLAASAAAFAWIGLAPDEVVACALSAINGYASTTWNVMTVSLRQQIVPSELFGRVNSAYRMIGWGLLPVGAITGGFVAQAFGLRAPYLLGGIAIGIAAMAALPSWCTLAASAAGR